MSKQIRKLCGEITALAIGIEKHDVFVDYAAHCRLFQVRIYSGGWVSYADHDDSITLRLSGDLAMSEQETIAALEEIKTKLENLLTTQ
jgi:hypothetical protein